MKYGFHHLDFSSRIGGVYARFIFPNGYGCSVIRGQYTYGGAQGLYEMAVLGQDGKITYDTDLTEDVLGYLTEEDVADYMNKISRLGSTSSTP